LFFILLITIGDERDAKDRSETTSGEAIQNVPENNPEEIQNTPEYVSKNPEEIQNAPENVSENFTDNSESENDTCALVLAEPCPSVGTPGYREVVGVPAGLARVDVERS